MTSTNICISLNDIAGVSPQVSTYAKVLRTLGCIYEIERIEPRQGKRRTTLGKVILRYRNPLVFVVFLDNCNEPGSDDLVTVVGVEEGSSLRTADGLYVGMAMVDAENVISARYCVHHRTSGGVEIISDDGLSQNYLWLQDIDDKVAFIGLYRRETSSNEHKKIIRKI